ncbi:MAG TPA: NAD(P)H-hydrate dehydratase [Thermoanaerobaculia bacterium]|nr:NAD(P)H-hydrate dehydratase [Thermoanaerobaculia bacterium]
MKILTADQMRSIDRRARDSFGIPSIVLMENAAIAVVDAIFEHYPDCERAAIFCGTGQNGGDGFAVARHLENRGVVPSVFLIGERSACAGDALTNLTICERLGIPMREVRDVGQVDEALAHAADADVIVDALLGTGLNRPPAGVQADLIRGIAELRIPVVAVDVPSGMSASSPQPYDPSLHAEVTVTFAAPKICHVFDPAASLCGEIIVADISIPEAAMEEEGVLLALTTPRDVQPFLAARYAATHKGTYGHVAIVAGSEGKSGAAVLCARGCIRTGAGLVSVVTSPDAAPLINSGSIESMTYPIALQPSSLDAILEFVDGKDAVVIGPGLRDDDPTYSLVRELTARIEAPLVVDASALNAFAGGSLPSAQEDRVRILTPHPGELARLIGSDPLAVNADRVGVSRELARQTRSIVVLKGHQTVIADPEGRVNVNPTGNPGMASGGMGDVLGGMIGALLARGVDPFSAACTAVYLHGFAGDLLKEEMGDTGLTAGDLAERIPGAITRIRDFRR